VSHTNSSFRVRVLSEQDVGEFSGDGIGDTSPRVKRAVYGKEDYGIGLYHATGAGDLAFYRVMRDCTVNGWNDVARFDCSGLFTGNTTSGYKDGIF